MPGANFNFNPSMAARTVGSSNNTSKATTLGTTLFSSHSRLGSNTNTDSSITLPRHSGPGSIWWRRNQALKNDSAKQLLESSHLPQKEQQHPQPTLCSLRADTSAMEGWRASEAQLRQANAVRPEPRHSGGSIGVGWAETRGRLIVVNRGTESLESGSIDRISQQKARRNGGETDSELSGAEIDSGGLSVGWGNWEERSQRWSRIGKGGLGQHDDCDNDFSQISQMPIASRELWYKAGDAKYVFDEEMDWFWADDGGCLRYSYCGFSATEDTP
ncbi:MAG: hypothetical protein Q9190_003545 [Brigantiaea leucoxantha]